MATKKTDIAVVSSLPEQVQRCEEIAQEFGYSCAVWSDVEKLFEEETPPSPQLMILSATLQKKEDAAGHVQVVRQLCQDAFIVCIVAKTLDEESASFIKRSGADVVMLDDEVMNSSKLEFICTQTLSATFMPVKVSELTAGVAISFDLYHLLPLRGKFLPCCFAGDVLDAEKLKKSAAAGELYIRRTEAEKFAAYTAQHTDRSAAGLSRRCRAQYLALTSIYIDLVYHLTDKSEYSSFKKGQELLAKCKDIAGQLGISLGGVGNAWEIINNSAIGTFGSADRSPAVASYAALFALTTGMDQVDDVMVAALLADLGLLYMNPKITKKLREDRLSELTALEREEYEKHPGMSLNLVLERKLPLQQDMRNVIVCTHEQVDGKGFPKKAVKVPKASELIHMGLLIDQATCVKMGRQRIDSETYRKDFMNKQFDSNKFSLELVARLRN